VSHRHKFFVFTKFWKFKILFFIFQYIYSFIHVVQCGKIHASVRKNLISLFKDQIDEGSAYVIESFMVGSNDHAYRTTDHKYKLNFMGGTKVFRVSSVNIPAHHFNFVPFLQIVSAAREDRLLGKKLISIQFNQT